MSLSQHSHDPLSVNVMRRGGLFDDEYLWRDQAQWLQSKGYRLRPRYHVGWVPSWQNSKKDPDDCEDGQSPWHTVVMDAIRESDNRLVSIKRVTKADHPQEEEITRYFSTENLVKDRLDNHSVPVYEVLQPPNMENIQFLVMPFLIHIHEVKFETLEETVECVRQLFEGLRFMHSQQVAHCDIHVNNVMMDYQPFFSERPHPVDLSRNYDFERRIKRYTRTGRPTKYYYIDFGLSYKFRPEEQNPIVPVAIGGDKSVPECQDPTRNLWNPFKVDVYCLGNVILNGMMGKVSGLDFLQPLIDDMMNFDPEKRPSMNDACARLEELSTSLSGRELMSHVVYRSKNPAVRLYRYCRHVFQTLWSKLSNEVTSPLSIHLPFRAQLLCNDR